MGVRKVQVINTFHVPPERSYDIFGNYPYPNPPAFYVPCVGKCYQNFRFADPGAPFAFSQILLAFPPFHALRARIPSLFRVSDPTVRGGGIAKLDGGNGIRICSPSKGGDRVGDMLSDVSIPSLDLIKKAEGNGGKQAQIPHKFC